MSDALMIELRYWLGGAIVVIAMSAMSGCRAAVEQDSRLSDGAPSVEALAAEALQGLAEGDSATLDDLRLTEYEHNQLVWPELPASNPEANFPVDFAWRNIQLRHRAALNRLLELYEGKALQLRHVECRGERQRFETFHVLTDCWVRFTADGEPQEHRLFKDVLVMDGAHKIFRYYADR